jgi:hypothetical protein
MMVRVANATRTLASAWATWQKRRTMLIARALGTSSTMVVSFRMASRAVESGSRMPSRTNIRQKSLRGVGDCQTLASQADFGWGLT